MFDFPKFEDIPYWFYRQSNCLFTAVDRSTDTFITNIRLDLNSEQFSDDDILVELPQYNTPEMISAFKLYALRPEYTVGSLIYVPDIVDDIALDKLAIAYDSVLLGACLLKHKHRLVTGGDPDTILPRLGSMLEWLNGNKFYHSPASSRFHEAYRGGLLVHSINVYNQMIKLHSMEPFSNVAIQSAAFTALVHDWCKIGMYESYYKNVKNEQTGQWEKQEAYKRNPEGIPLGHGVTSMYYASKFAVLTDEEALAIRWHMSHWNVCDGEVDEFQRANERYPLVHMLQFADQLAITDYGNTLQQ